MGCTLECIEIGTVAGIVAGTGTPMGQIDTVENSSVGKLERIEWLEPIIIF